MIERRKIKKAVAYAMLLCFTSLTGAQPLYAIPANTQLPTGGNTIIGEVKIPSQSEIVNNTMNITQSSTTSVIQWGNFSIGADATVNFIGKNGVDFTGHNSLNYVTNGGPISEIYGQLNALGGNIFIANPAGVQIGNSAQINVGSLYVTNKAFDAEKIKEQLKADSSTGDIASYIAGIAPNTNPAAELMSLGSITSATNVTFDGGRIVLDVDRFFKTEADGSGGKTQMTADELKGTDSEAGSLIIKTNDKDNVVLGYTGYVENEQGEANYSEKGTFDGFKVTVTGVDEDGNVTETPNQTIAHGYMWVEDLDQLQKIAEDGNLDGWYALRNSIDANYTASDSYNSGFDNGTTGLGFKPIGEYNAKAWGGTDPYEAAFQGRFDGLGYSLFGLNIKREKEKGVGLFGAVHGDTAVVRNIILNGGSIAGGDNVGSVAGIVAGGARIEKITNTADVSGKENVGGIAGALESKTNEVTNVTDLVNIGKVGGHQDIGGIIGSATGINLGGTVYNLGGVAGDNETSLNVGGLIGMAQKSAIGDGESQIYNRANVTGGFNVGGIVGAINDADTGSTTPSIKFSTVTNAANYGDVTATGSETEEYLYHTLVTNENELPYGTNLEGNIASVNVKVANAGGIVGSSVGIEGDDETKKVTLENVRNTGDVKTSSTKTIYEYTIRAGDGTESTETAEIDQYQAGNVGGIVGSATHTNITNAENSENKISGAHNVGGIAGYLEAGTVRSSGNDGGEITATGARNERGFVQEYISKPDGKSEEFYIGNIGGIVGYLFGDKAKIENSGNRGNVHSALIEENATTMPDEARAANAGGVVGKADVGVRHYLDTANDNTGIKNAPNTATISGSYNTGDVQGYTGVGGVAGLMYQGSIAGSYNYGAMSSTRTAGNAADREPLNLGGIVGDTTNISGGAGTIIYDVYNSGQIGDETFTYYGRHVGGIAGRLSGDIEKAYNTGDIYNGYSVVGGIAGWWHGGSIKNVFNTGNITVLNRDTGNQYSEVGGIVGASGASATGLSYAYNLGTLRSIIGKGLPTSNGYGHSAVGGIIGRVRTQDLTISNVYTTNNIYAGVEDGKGDIIKDNGADLAIGAIYATIDTGAPSNGSVTITDAYLVELYKSKAFDFSKFNKDGVESTTILLNNAKQQNSYSGFFNEHNTGWRIYEGKTLPILNAFTPDAAKHEDSWLKDNVKNQIQENGVQYGTAANPLLTIINAKEGAELEIDGQALGLHGAGSLAVYGNDSLTLTNFGVTLGSHYNGTVYSDGALTITTGNAEGALYNLGSGSRLYGSSVTFDAGGRDAGLYGKITATNGGVDIKGKNVTVLGELSTPVRPEEGEKFTTTVLGIAQEDNAINGLDSTTLNNLNTALPTVGQANAFSKTTTNFDGDINIEASGVAEVLFGSMGGGKITSGGDLSVTGEQGIFADSDFHIGGDMNLTSRVTNDDGTVTGGEVVLDLSNMGKTSSGESESDVEHMHKYFLDHFKKNEDGQSAGKITVDVANDEDFIIGLDMWDESEGTFDFTKYDVENQGDDNHTLYEDIEDLNLTIKVNGAEDEHSSYRNHVFTWIESAAHLKAVQGAGEEALSYNFALKDDIDASQLSGYTPIASGSTTNTDGSEQAYNGIFDGRGFRIIGLNANLDEDGTEHGENDAHSRAGIFGTIGNEGKVRDLSVYASKFTGKAAAGAIAGVNKGEIKDVITFGNEVKVLGKESAYDLTKGGNDGGDMQISAAGGVAGVNIGVITGSDRTAADLGSAHASDTVIAGGSTDTIFSAAGGVAGVNVREDKTEAGEGKGLIEKVSSTSAVRSDNIDKDGATKTHGLGGVAGINDGRITDAEAHGATNTLFGLRSDGEAWDENVGGITGVNYGELDGVYNESAVAGKTNVGGVAGKNEIRGETQATIENAVNAGPVFSRGGGDDATNAGGIAGANYGKITGGRNTDEVTGTTNVGGVVGLNAFGALLQNISNAIAAEIRGTKNVGGIAGSNAGNITSSYNLVNEGLIEGKTNVGGVAGVNEAEGRIISTIAPDGEDDIVINSGSITGVENVGGIAGTNKGTIKGRAEEGTARSANLGSISGNKNVGGIVGVNEEGATIENTNTDVTMTAIGVDENGNQRQAKNFGGVAGTNKGTITNATNKGTITAYGAQNVGGIAGVNEMGDGGTGGLLENAGNEGTVIGGSHVAGVVGINKSNKADGTIENSGTVIATAGGAAGIIYENTADLGGIDKTLELVNSGTVVGFSRNDAHGTGGVIGVNSGNIDYASLISTVESAVTGGWNTGGLIGYNTGEITGGRALAANGLGYYAYKIYNNGEVTGTQNVGGLIGNNAVVKDATTGDITSTGTLTAGYNTGRVMGVTADNLKVTKDDIELPEGTELPEDEEINLPLTDTLEGGGKGESVGGVAGTNAGILDRIFNFVMMNDGKGDKVSGVSNAGGVVGSNEQGGEVTNAYNATAVEATGDGGVKGNVAGTNDGIIENIYAANTSGSLIGTNNNIDDTTNAYTFAAGDDSATTVLTGGEQNQAASYRNFDFTGADGEKAVWKIYEGYGAPLLKVFLTEARYDGETGLMQTGGPLGLPISGVTAGDGLEAYRADNSLLVALKNAGVGDGYIAFTSKQIGWSDADGGFNPNWLGYDIDAVYDITPNHALLLTQNNGHLHWLHRGGDRHRNFRERKAEIYFHEGGMVHE